MLARAAVSKRHLRRWAFWSGVLGLGMTAALLTGLIRPVDWHWHWAWILWPTALYGLGFNNDLEGVLHAVPVMFGGQFLIYGVVGLAGRMTVYLICRATKR